MIIWICYNSSMIIDFHTHIFPPQIRDRREDYLRLDPLFNLLYSNPKAALATGTDIINMMDHENIDMAVVLNLSWSSFELCQETNDYIMEVISKNPSRLIGFGMISFDSQEKAIREIERCARGGIKGIGELRPSLELLYNLDAIRPVIQKIIDNNLILLVHSSEPIGHYYPGKGEITPENLYPFITAFPELKIVCAHWGGGLPFYALMPEVKISLGNVYFDSAASPFLYQPQIYSQAVNLAGAEKILFGSDYPLLSPRRLLNEIEGQQLSPELKNLFLSDNAKKLLGI
jgi:uncharacterized protein